MRTYERAAGLLLVTAGLGTVTVACSDDGGHDRADYVAALSGVAEGYTEEEAACAAGAIVDVVGVDALEEAGAFDKIQDDPEGSLSDFGVEISEAQGGELYDAVGECKDLRALFIETMTGAGASPDVAQCLLDQIDDATFERIVVTGFTEGDEAVDADADVQATFEAAAQECVTPVAAQ